MPGLLGRHAIVVGAGIGGLAAAKALSSLFETVTVLERDALPSEPIARIGTLLQIGNTVFKLGYGRKHGIAVPFMLGNLAVKTTELCADFTELVLVVLLVLIQDGTLSHQIVAVA